MHIKSLFTIIILAFIVGCSKDATHIDNSKSSLYKNPLSLSGEARPPADEDCKNTAGTVFGYKEVSLYNHKYRRYLTSEWVTTGTWDGAHVFLDLWYIGWVSRDAQRWQFRSVRLSPKYGGWVYAISNKVGFGIWRDLAMDLKDYQSDNGSRETYPLKLFSAPDVSKDVGVFEFIIIECTNNGRHPRGLLVHRATGRLVQVRDEDYVPTPQVVFGEKYNIDNKDNYDDKYLWEALPMANK